MSNNDYKTNAQKILDEAPVGFITITRNTPWGERRDKMNRVIYMATLRAWQRKGLISNLRGVGHKATWVKNEVSNEGTK